MILLPACVIAFGLTALESVAADPSSIYFLSGDDGWEKVRPEEVGWDSEKLKAALDYAGKNESTGVVVLHRGKILAEEYWEIDRVRGAKARKNKLGRPIEDVASVQKSVVSILVGIAQEKDLLKIDDHVDKYLGTGWSKATPEQEKAITIRHLITMTSGLSDRGRFEAKAGTKWRYNTPVYAKTMEVLEKAAKMDRHELTREWLTMPLGMADSKWVRRGTPELRRVNSFGFATTARDLARFGLMMLAKGLWNHSYVMGDQRYLKAATMSSQNKNPYYGYLWWVNRDSNSPDKAPRIKAAPADMFSANGALNRRCFVAPSLDLVVTRLGDRPNANRGFDQRFWELLMGARRSEAQRD